MKLSDIKGEQAFETLDRVTPIIEKLSLNADFLDLLNVDVGSVEDKTQAAAIAADKISNNIRKYLPKLMKSASKELTLYTEILTGAKAEDITLGNIFQTLIDMLNDPVFLNFFALYRPKTTVKS